MVYPGIRCLHNDTSGGRDREIGAAVLIRKDTELIQADHAEKAEEPDYLPKYSDVIETTAEKMLYFSQKSSAKED